MTTLTTRSNSLSLDNSWDTTPRSLLGPLFCLWLLTLLTFSIPGREGPIVADSLDSIAIAKVAARALTMLMMSYVLLRELGTPSQRTVGYVMLPTFVYVGWSIVSTAWSPLKAVSLGQAGGFTAQILIATALGIRWSGPRDTSRILKQLSIALLILSVAVGAVDLINHEWSGLNRTHEEELEGSSGLVHPTTAGSTASLGLLIVCFARLLWNWRWTRVLLVPAIVAHGYLLYLAASRMALLMTAMVLGLGICMLLRRNVLAALVLGACAIGLLYLAIDPRMDVADRSLGLTAGYLSRGESADSLTSLTGRTDLWEAIWNEYLESPLLGHGYFVTSSDGMLDVWSGPENRTAHNVVLQVLSTTGLIGMAIALWAFGRFGLEIVRVWYRDAGHRTLLVFLGLMALWFAGWGLLSESFLGTVSPESTVFFTLLALSLGAIARPSWRTAA